MTLRLLSPTAILGYGFPRQSLEAGLARHPDAIGVDAGSTDPGPYYLGAGVSFTDRAAVSRDLELLLEAALKRHIPLIIGSAGGSGAHPHLDWTLEIIRELAGAHGWRFRAAVISADVDKELVRKALHEGRVSSLGPVDDLTEEALDATTHVVAQMGVEPFIEALRGDADVIIAGRSYDPAIFAALPVAQGCDRGLALHLGKILECAAIAAVPGSGSDCLLGCIGDGWFSVEALAPTRRCTPTSVAAHTLYEKSDPYRLPGPGGEIDLSQATFEDIESGVVRVAGSRFVPSGQYRLKLEGARLEGHRAVSVAGARDPVFIEHIEEILGGVRERVVDQFGAAGPDSYRLDFIVYGRDGVMGPLEPHPAPGHEVGIVMAGEAADPLLAKAVVAFARSTMLHYGYPGRKSTAGNLAFPFSPSDFSAGAVYRFTLNHLLDVEDPASMFPIQMQTVE